jgi:hypothetical protein
VLDVSRKLCDVVQMIELSGEHLSLFCWKA